MLPNPNQLQIVKSFNGFRHVTKKKYSVFWGFTPWIVWWNCHLTSLFIVLLNALTADQWVAHQKVRLIMSSAELGSKSVQIKPIGFCSSRACFWFQAITASKLGWAKGHWENHGHNRYLTLMQQAVEYNANNKGSNTKQRKLKEALYFSDQMQ